MRKVFRKMRADFYVQLNKKIRGKPRLVRVIVLSDKILTAVCFILYPVYEIYLSLTDRYLLVKTLSVPAVSFVVISLLRMFINAKRPSEICGLKPILSQTRCDRSFPSRHVFSAFAVAVAFAQSDIRLGIIFCFIGTMIAVLRVAGGVHFVRDVVVGAFVGLTSCAIYPMYPF